MLKATIGQICFVRMRENDDLIDTIKKSAEENRICAGMFTLIGALKDVVLACYENGEYTYTHLDGPMEIASCMGNIAVDEKGEVIIHAHIVVSNVKGEAFGGHLSKDSRVGPTAELMIIEAAGVNLQRIFDDSTKLKLLRLG